MVERFAGNMLFEIRRLKELPSSILEILTDTCLLQSSVSKNLVLSC